MYYGVCSAQGYAVSKKDPWASLWCVQLLRHLSDHCCYVAAAPATSPAVVAKPWQRGEEAQVLGGRGKGGAIQGLSGSKGACQHRVRCGILLSCTSIHDYTRRLLTTALSTARVRLEETCWICTHTQHAMSVHVVGFTDKI